MDQLERLTLKLLMLFTIRDFGCALDIFERMQLIVYTSKPINHLSIYVDSNLHHNTSLN